MAMTPTTMPVVDGSDPTTSVLRRIVAWILDELLLFAVTAFAIWITPVTFVDRSPVPGVAYYEPEGSAAALAVFFLMPLAYWIGNFVVLQGIEGFTLGKYVLSLRTVRFDGRPPGVWRALLRSGVLAVGLSIGGCVYAVIALVMVYVVKGHRRLGDILAGTFVIDAFYAGRIIRLTANGASVGPPSVYASDVSAAVVGPGGDRALVEAKLRPDDPVFDKQRDTYVVWNARQERLLVFDTADKTWKPAE